MTKQCTKQKKEKSQFVECDKCAMQAVCQPLSSETKTLDLTSHYLTRRIPANQNSTIPSQNKGSVIFEQNKKLTSIYSVCSGVFKLYEENADGTQKVIGFRFPGELMAEDAIYFNQYNYSAVSLGDSSVCEVSIEHLTACSKIAPELQQNLIHLLAKQSYEQQLNAQALIGRKSTESLLAAFLVNLSQRYAKYLENEAEIELIIGRGDIANLLGIRRETLSRLLAKFQQTKLISLQGKNLKLLSIEGLQRLISE